jgi:hypothetical protein
MTSQSLHNGKYIPEYIFTDRVRSYCFIEFEFAFSNEFWVAFKILLEKSGIKRIRITNLKPDNPFSTDVDVTSLPDGYTQVAESNVIESDISDKVSFHLLTEKALIFAPDNENRFCILLDREYEIAVIGFSSPQVDEALTQFAIDDMPNYLTLAFAGKELPSAFKDTLNKNWKAL